MAGGAEDAVAIPVTLTGSDIDGTVVSYRLSGLPTDGVLYTDAALITLAATGTDYAATAEALTLYFVPDADWNGAASFDYTATDDQGVAGAFQATATITVAAVDDSALIGGPASESVYSNTGLMFSSAHGNRISVADTDATAANMEVMLTTKHGHVDLARKDGLSFLVGDGTGDEIVRFSGTGADVNAALEGLMFKPDSDFSGVATLKVVAGDMAAMSGGAAVNTLHTVNISVTTDDDTGSTPETPLDELIIEYIKELDPPSPTPDGISPVTTTGGPGSGPGVLRSSVFVAAADDADDETTSERSSSILGALNDVFARRAGLADVGSDDDGPGLWIRSLRLMVTNPAKDITAALEFDAEDPAWRAISNLIGDIDIDGDGLDGAYDLLGQLGTGLTFTLTAGYVSWLLRAGYLSATIMSSLPLWRTFDPLPILAKPKDDKDEKVKIDQEAKDPAEANDIAVEERLFDMLSD